MKKLIIFGMLAVLVSVGLVYLYGGSQTPQGQHPLESLSPQNVSDVENAFNAASGEVRVLLLLSPT